MLVDLPVTPLGPSDAHGGASLPEPGPEIRPSHDARRSILRGGPRRRMRSQSRSGIFGLG